MRTMFRMAAAAVLAAAILAAAALGPFRGGGAADGTNAARGSGRSDVGSLLTPGVGGSLERTIASLQERVRAFPSDWRAAASLGLAYVQQARVTTDPRYYPKAEGILTRSLELNERDNAMAMVGMAALDSARHRFTEALGWAERAKAINPYDGNVDGVIGDALAELGRYDEAFAAYQAMVDRRPGLPSYARVAAARELTGDVAGALAAMKAAARLAATPADASWASYQLGELYWNTGRVERAATAYRRATGMDPSYVPPRAGLAKVAWARGDLDGAIRGYTWVTRRIPSSEFVSALGNLYLLAGDRAAADRQFELVRAIGRLFRANGVNIGLEQALFEADQGDPEVALRAARAEWRRRHGTSVADALAWALYANGRYAEADRFARRALALGTRNALFSFHAGMIRLRLGDEPGARRLLSRAVATNPHFSIRYAELARRTLAALGADR